MATVPAANSTATLGIDNLLTDFTVLSENIDETENALQIPDQQGAIVNELHVDTRYDLSLSVYGTGTLPATGITTFSYANATWKVDKISKAGTHNDYQKYNITAHRSTNYPAGA